MDGLCGEKVEHGGFGWIQKLLEFNLEPHLSYDPHHRKISSQ